VVVWCGSVREEGAASRRDPWAGASAEQQEEHAGAVVLLLLARLWRRSEHLLFVRRRGERAGHDDVAALSGAAGIDDDAPRGEGGL
jgi:hypothetical protein